MGDPKGWGAERMGDPKRTLKGWGDPKRILKGWGDPKMMGDPKRRGNLKGWVALKDGEPKRSLKGWGEWGGPHGDGGQGGLKGA